jgi:hypothetical protein
VSYGRGKLQVAISVEMKPKRLSAAFMLRAAALLMFYLLAARRVLQPLSAQRRRPLTCLARAVWLLKRAITFAKFQPHFVIRHLLTFKLKAL